MVLVARLMSIFVSALGGPGFLFFIHTAHGLLAPHGSCCPLCWSDSLSNYRKGWIPHPDQSPMIVLSPVYQDWEVAHPAQQTQPYPELEDTSSRKSGRCPGMLGGFKTPSSFSLATSSAVKSSKSPGRPGKHWICGSKGPTVWNGISWHVNESINGAAWLHSMTRSGNNLGPNCMPLGMRRHPPVVNFLSAGFQLTTDNSHLHHHVACCHSEAMVGGFA